MKLKLHHNKNRLGLHHRPQWGSLQRSPKPPSWISIYRPFGPLLSALRASIVSDSSFGFSDVGMSATTVNGKVGIKPVGLCRLNGYFPNISGLAMRSVDIGG